MLCSPPIPTRRPVAGLSTARHVDIVTEMQAKLESYTPYVDGRVEPQELAHYHCSPSVRQRWNTPVGRFAGPCCEPK